MESRTAWLHFCGVTTSVADDIRKTLSCSGIDFQSFDYGKLDRNGIVCFSASMENCSLC